MAGKVGHVELVKADVGLGAVDNTADIDKPISIAVSLALGAKQDRLLVDRASTTFTAETNKLILVNSSSGAFSITLPANPEDYSFVDIHDVAGTFQTNNITVVGNGKNIMGDTTLLLDTQNITIRLLYTGTEWRIL